MGENDPYFCVSLSAGAERLLRQSIHPNRLGFFGSDFAGQTTVFSGNARTSGGLETSNIKCSDRKTAMAIIIRR